MMLAYRQYIQIFILLYSFFTPALSNTMSFTPDHPLCTGETVQMVCIIIVPTDIPNKSLFTSAQISFNGSNPTFPTTLHLLNLDTSRYIGDYTGLNVTKEMPGAWLNISYIPSDSSIVFGCHAFLDNAQTTEALVTGQMMRPAVVPESVSPTSTLSTLSADTCSNIQISWLPSVSERSIDTYTVYRNGAVISTVDSNSYTDNTELLLNTDYIYSVVATSCAGNSTHGYTSKISIPEYSIVNNSLMISYDRTAGILTTDWSLSNTLPSPPLLSLTYKLHLNYSYTQQNITQTITFTQLSNNTSTSSIIYEPVDVSADELPNKITAMIMLIRQCGQDLGTGEDNPTDSPMTTTIQTTTVYTTVTEPTVDETNSDYKYFNTRGRLYNGDYCNNNCNPALRICVILEQSSTTLDCSSPYTVYPIVITEPYTRVNNVTFDDRIGRESNPVKYNTLDTFNGRFSILIEAINYNTPNNSIVLIDTVYIQINITEYNKYSDVMLYRGSRNTYPTISALRYQLHEVIAEVNSLDIANGGMGIFNNPMQMIFLLILLCIGVVLILSAVCCMIMLCRVKARERNIISGLPKNYLKRKRRNSKVGLLTGEDNTHKHNTYNSIDKV
ncbi:hypothetical protein LOD99_9397 [Oopsacas minuta]|uniref:Fibronectin type-III domain-containing protein n=1 Tax=Oopsacas minuta TaxID=111878 RepID=A0AAV7JCJ9_9METZ|nr:hypothetical protein LOD99_9397 [Oopsacas minuta]